MAKLSLTKPNSNNGAASLASQFMQVLSEAEMQSHVWHLQTKSFAQHKALNMFYDEIVELKDSLLESYQGIHGVVLNGGFSININSNGPEMAEGYFKSLRSKVAVFKGNSLMSAGCLQNQLDTIEELVAKISYLLTLK